MVYESGFTTRRSYATRPIVSSYTISCPTVERFSRVYKATYPIYSTYAIPYVGYDGGFTSSRVVTSPVRVVTTPTRIVSRVLSSPSPVRVVRTTRVISSPEPASYYSSTYVPSSYVTSSYVYSTPTYVGAPVTRVYSRSLSPVRRARSPVRSTPSYLKRAPPGYGARALTNYLNTEPFETFKDETNRIRHRAQSLMRDLHTPVVRRSRSCTPFPVSGYAYEPASQLAFDAYLARITNPVRHVAKEIYKMSHYAEPASKYVGKSHLASVRICGNKAYDVRRPMYDSDRIRTDINLRSWYLRHPPHSSLKVLAKREKQDGNGAVHLDRVVHHNDVVEHDAVVEQVDAVQVEA